MKKQREGTEDIRVEKRDRKRSRVEGSYPLLGDGAAMKEKNTGCEGKKLTLDQSRKGKKKGDEKGEGSK